MLAETRLLSEYLVAKYPDDRWFQQLPVGRDPEVAGIPVLDDAERRYLRRFNRRVDAVVVRPGEMVVIEATMFKPTEKVGKLQEYMLLLSATADLREWLHLPRRAELVTAQDDAVARVLCERQGFGYVFWEPDWMAEFWAIYPNRRRRAPHAGFVRDLADRELTET